MSIPVAYVTSSNGPETGLIEEKGLKIESIDARVGVTLITNTFLGTSKVLVLPDKVLDKRYRLTAIEGNNFFFMYTSLYNNKTDLIGEEHHICEGFKK